MYRYNKLWVLVCISAILLLALRGIAQEPPGQSKGDTPTASDSDVIEGIADEAEQDEEAGIIKLIGHVKIKRPNGYLNADEVTIYKDIEDPRRPVVKTVARGHVDMKDGELTAICETAIFDEVKNIVELRGSVVVLQGEDRVEAEEVVLDRATNKRIFRGGVKFKVAIQTKTKQSEEAAADTKTLDKESKEQSQE